MSGVQNDLLRENFKASLGKLLALSTRELALKQIRALVLQNKTTSSLRVWLSVLFEQREKHVESEISVLAYIVEQYGPALLDPLDKVPSLEKTVFRIMQLLSRFFNDPSPAVGMACQRAWVQIYLSALSNQPCENNKKLLFDSLEAMLLGGADRLSQVTAQIVIDGLLEASLSRQDHGLFKLISKRTLVLFLKTTVPHWASLTCLHTILAYFAVPNLLPLLEQVVSKIVQYIQSAPKDSVGFKIKAEACNVLSLIGEQIGPDGLPIYHQIYSVLEDLATDRVLAVQNSGRRAQSIWKQNKQKWDQDFQSKQEPLFDDEQFESKYQESRKEFPTKPYVTENNFFKPPISIQKPGPVTGQNWNPSKQPFNARGSEPVKPYLQKQSGVNASNFLEPRRTAQSYNQKMEEIKRSVFQAKPDFTEYDETIPWQNIGKEKGKEKGKDKGKEDVKQVEAAAESYDKELVVEWEKIVELAEKGKMEEAVKLLLQMDDDMYFLRFLLAYQGVLQKLTKKTTTLVLKLMLRIRQTSFLEGTLLRLTQQSIKGGITKLLSNGINSQISRALEQCKVPKLQKAVNKVKANFEQALAE